MNLDRLKYILLNLFRKNRTDNLLNVAGVAITFLFISLIFMFIHQTRGNAAPEVYKDRTILVGPIQLENDRYFVPDSAHIHYFEQLKEPDQIGYINWQSPYIFNGHTVTRTGIGYVNAGFFEIFRYKYTAGRSFTQQEMEDKEPVLTMSNGYAKRFFGTTDVVGKKIEIQNRKYTIVGVFEKGSFPNIGWQDLYIPYTLNNYLPQRDRTYRFLLKAKDVPSVKKVNDELNAFLLQLYNQKTINRKPLLQEYLPMKYMSTMYTFYTNTQLAITILLLLLIPAFNIISLNNGKISDQLADVSVKRSYGASKRSILQDLLLENMLITLMGAIIGFLLTYPFIWLIMDTFNSYMSFPVSLWMEYDALTLFGIFLMVMVFSLLSSYLPVRRVLNIDIADGLKGGEV